MKNLLPGIFFLLATTLLGQSSVPPAVGAGTMAYPYQISSLGNLYWIAENSSRWASHYIQTENIDASETSTWFSDASGGYYGWSPIGNSSIQFTGNYNGDGYSIDGLYINRTSEDYQGLFGYTNGATISKLGVINVNIAGYYYVGGLVGENYSSILNNCYSTGNISGYIYVGGLVGRNNNNSTIRNSYSTGGVECDYYFAGGLLGANFNTSRVENSYSTGNVTTTSNNVGGLTGANFYSSTVENCYSKGNVIGQFTVGGLMGYNYQSTLNNSYSTGTATGSGTVGGCVARNEAALNNCYWDIETSGQTTSSGGTGKTTAEMKTLTTFTNAGWDFTSVWKLNSNDNDGYPNLLLQNFSPQAYAPESGNGTPEDPYQIANVGNLYWIAADAGRWDKHYIQVKDIDASETADWIDGGWKPIGTELNNFTGTYDGNFHIINGLTINHEIIELYWYEGLFGIVSYSTISALGLTNVKITSCNQVGALCGSAVASTISNCFSTGSITANSGVGGLLGICGSSIVMNCYSNCTVNGVTVTGGLIANNQYSTVTESYSASDVNGNTADMIGGLMGYNLESSVNNCFWDIEISGQSSSAAGIGKTTAEMKSAATFLNAGWNPQDWKMDEGFNNGYPYLAWQNPDGGSLFVTPILISPVNNSIGVSLSDTLRWSFVPGADRYKLELNEQSDFLGAIIFNADTLNDTLFVLNGFEHNKQYFWRVTAMNNYGFSSDTSDVFSFTTKLNNVNLNLPLNNATRMDLATTLKWNKVEGADRYKLELNAVEDFSGTIIFNADSLVDTLKTLDSLANNSTCYWRVTALSGSGNFSEPSVVFSFTTKLRSATLTNPINNQINISLTPTLTWQAVNGADSYRLEINVQPDYTGEIIFDQDTINSSVKKIGGLTDNTDYYWRVTAHNSSGNASDTSTTYKFSTGHTVLSSIPNGAIGVATTPTLRWEKTSGASNYRLEVNNASDFTGLTVLDSTEIADTSCTLNGLMHNTTYYWRVTASSDALLKTNTSPVYSFTTKLITPVLYAPLNNSTDISLSPALSWSVVTGAEQYKLEIDTKPDFSGTALYITNTSSELNNLENNTTYYWRVRALNSFGNTSDTSSTFKFTTLNITGIDSAKLNLPCKYQVFQNYPNPFNPSTRISWQSPVGSWQTLKIYDILGNQVAILVNEYQEPGTYEIIFDASDLASGMYLYRLEAGSFVESRKMLLIR